MGESTCLMHSFSFTSAVSNEGQEGNPMYGFGDSVSFGRFMTEPLAWEKWSTFSRNRYVDEAKSYSKPGSVAQKKAYFEAHFKRMAALKAAALLEQQQKQQNNTITTVVNRNYTAPKPPSGGIQAMAALIEKQQRAKRNNTDSTQLASRGSLEDTTTTGPQLDEANSSTEEVFHDAVEVLNQKSNLILEEPELNNVQVTEVAFDQEEVTAQQKSEADAVKKVRFEEDGSLELPPVNNNNNNNHDHDKDNTPSISCFEAAEEINTTPTIKNDDVVEGKDQVEETIPAVMVDFRKSNSGTSIMKPSSSNQEVAVETPVPVTKKNPPLSSFIPAVEIGAFAAASPSSPARTAVRQQVTHPGKENMATPIGKKSWLHHDPDKKRTPLRMSINREFSRLISPVIKKIGSSSKASSKDCTPARPSVDGAADHHHPLETPQSGRRRARALFDSSAGGSSSAPAAAGTREQTTILSPDGGKSPSIIIRNKSGAPVMSAFCLRHRDKSAQKRKEKLEEKERKQPSKSKVKKTKEINKLRQSFCFGARLSSESFRERDRAMRTSAVDSSTATITETGAGSSLPPRKSSLKNQTSQHHSSTSS